MPQLNPIKSASNLGESANSKEPWFWFVLAPLIGIVFVCSALIYFSVSGADDIVIDDYYKEGRLINNRFDLELEAANRSLAVDVVFDIQTQEVMVQSEKPLLVSRLTLTLSHPADVGKDFIVSVPAVTQSYFKAELPKALQGKWYVILNGVAEGGEAVWRMSSELDFSASTRLSMRPNQD